MIKNAKTEAAADGGPLEKQATSQGLVLTALIVGAVTLGMSPILVRLSELGPTASAFHRVFLALPVLWLWGALEKRRQSTVANAAKATRKDYSVMVLAGFFFAGDLLCWHWSLQYTSVANATMLATMAPIWVTLGSYFLFRERFSRLFLLGLCIAIFGAAVLMGDSFQFSRERLFGDLLGVGTGVFFGSYILTVGRLRAHFSTASIMFLTTAVTAVLLLPATLISGESLIAQTLYGWTVLLGLALLTHVGGQGAIAYALAHLSSAFTAVAMLLEGVAAIFLAWIILSEVPGGWQIVGACIVIGGVIIARRGNLQGDPA
ncbi:MAG: DMT family transporter [Rhodospirillaceae bacterium]|nr:DMT family transporter [Rhodospirillaceae bacterium]MBL6930795.1 DMT family transporter [Rhodospirillales bacterium]